MTRYPKAGKGKQWTVRELECAPTDWQKDTLADSGGLFGEVQLTQKGAISIRFRYRFRWEGKARWFHCGAWPAVSLAQIRKERDRARQLVAEGINPSLAKQAAKIEKKAAIAETVAQERQQRVASLTVNDLFNEWIANGVARADGNTAISSAFALDVLPALGNKPLCNLTDTDLLNVLRKAKERITSGKSKKSHKGGNYSVLTLARDVTQMLGWAEKRQPWRGLLIEGNPADLVDIKSLLDADFEGYRERVLSADEIQTLHAGLLPIADMTGRGCINRRFRFAVWLCLSTTCRIGELLAAKWEHIDWQAGTWLIPAGNTKGKRGKRQGQLVTLSDFALNQFKQLQAETGGGIYCFPSSTGGLIERKLASSKIAKYQKEGGLFPVLSGGHWTLHDMRRTGATMMQGLGVSPDVIDYCQNHVLAGSKTRRHYLHYKYAKEAAAAWQALGKHLEAIIQGNPA